MLTSRQNSTSKPRAPYQEIMDMNPRRGYYKGIEDVISSRSSSRERSIDE